MNLPEDRLPSHSLIHSFTSVSASAISAISNSHHLQNGFRSAIKCSPYSQTNAAYGCRAVLKRLADGSLLSGCGGDLEVIGVGELEHSQHTGLPIRVTRVGIFGGADTLRGIYPIQGTYHILVTGDRHAALIDATELCSGSALSPQRILRLPATILSLCIERHAKGDLLLAFLLDSGIYHYTFTCGSNQGIFECVQCFRCSRIIQSGILWRDGGLLHVAYYDGYVRVGIVHEDYEDMIFLRNIIENRRNLTGLIEVVDNEIERIDAYEKEEQENRDSMLEAMNKIKQRLAMNEEELDETNAEGPSEAATFGQLKFAFKTHSIRADRVSQRLGALRRLIVMVHKAMEANIELNNEMEKLNEEIEQLAALEKTVDCIDYSQMEERKEKTETTLRQVKSLATREILRAWDLKMDNLIDSLRGTSDSPKDMRIILTQNIFEHRSDKKDHFTHFLLDFDATELTLYCMSGLTTIAVYPRKGKRVASISLHSSYETSLTTSCVMAVSSHLSSSSGSVSSIEGVYVADQTGVFPIYFCSEKRYLDAGAPVALPPFDYINSILCEKDSMFLGGVSGGLLHLAFDPTNKFDHTVIYSSLLCQPFCNGPVLCLHLLPVGDCYLALHGSHHEFVVSERDQDRWHRVTHHVGGAHCIAATHFNAELRGAFLVVGSATYVRLKALQYTEENLVGMHDMGESRGVDETGKEIEVIDVSLDPSMEFRPLPCKLRYAVGFADKAIRTYVALLTGQHDFTVAEKFIAQIEPLHAISLMICFHGRPMGCYASCAKTLQVWNDLDRHQQKKMKSERMQLHKMDTPITTMDRIEAKSCYLLLGYKDNRVEIFEEKGRGTGKIESCGSISNWNNSETPREVLELRTRTVSTTHSDRLFIHSLDSSSILIHTALIESGSLVHSQFILRTQHSLPNPKSYCLFPSRSYEFLIYGEGATIHSLSLEERQKMELFKDFEF
ncbi:hypothetical protein WR25_25946 isoform A [Diploscapter pachys]|uniref:Uncharacterized protein n=1 Tax=Diploscapter pachys TaxID=2018661 RepID=A0A2A2KSE3_9BILA|nr:hypothetical protein WR25_25946 isoform A [Diploscapter pachys]